MRLFAYRIRRGHVPSGLIATLLVVNGTAVSPGQDAESKRPARNKPNETLAAGTEVVFTCPSSSVTNNERLARISCPPPYVIDRIDGDRVLLCSRQIERKRYVARAQIQSFSTAIDDLSGQIARRIHGPPGALGLVLRSSGRTTATTSAVAATWTKP